MTNEAWTNEEEEAFNEVERNSNLGKQILRDMGQPYYFDPSNGTISKDKNDPRFTPLGQLWPVSIKREWVGLTNEEIKSIEKMALTKQMAIEMAIATAKEKNT